MYLSCILVQTLKGKVQVNKYFTKFNMYACGKWCTPDEYICMKNYRVPCSFPVPSVYRKLI